MEIIYDSFFSGSFIDIKGCVQIIRQQDKDFSEKHMNILRYTTKHLNDENTPKAIKSLFAFTGWKFSIFFCDLPIHFSKRLNLSGKKMNFVLKFFYENFDMVWLHYILKFFNHDNLKLLSNFMTAELYLPNLYFLPPNEL